MFQCGKLIIMNLNSGCVGPISSMCKCGHDYLEKKVLSLASRIHN